MGVANDVKARLNSYQTSDPKRAYQLEYSIHTDKFRELEQYIHENLIIDMNGYGLKDIIKAIEGYEKTK